MIEVRQTDEYAEWFKSLRDRQARARINTRIGRLTLGKPGDVKPVGEGVLELRIDYVPGYRIDDTRHGETVVILLAGGNMRSQNRDIKTALEQARKLQEAGMPKKTKTRPWDAAEHLESKEDMAAYLEAALEDGDPALVAAALGDIARAKGMANIARETGLGRESLYKALSPEGNPEFATVMKVVRALGLKLRATTSEP